VLHRRERAAATTAPVADPQTGAAARAGARDPVRLFAALAAEAPFRGALVLDDQGQVLAGRLESGEHSADLLGALLATTVAEAGRTTGMLELGGWENMLLETDSATLHLTALAGGAVLVVVAEPDTPAGWVVRAAGRAADMARRFMEEGA